jgi:hypothetical protein
LDNIISSQFCIHIGIFIDYVLQNTKFDYWTFLKMEENPTMRYRTPFLAVTTIIIIIGLTACKASDDSIGGNGNGTDQDADAGIDGGSNGNKDTDNSNDGGENETDGGIDTDTGYDIDNDGFSGKNGDCDDSEPFVNPNAIEDLGPDGNGDLVDNDCDGETDEEEGCDCPDVGAKTAELVMAIDLCDTRFVSSVKKIYSSTNTGAVAFGTVSAMGNNDCLYAHRGCEMAVLSTGPVGQPNPNNAIGMGAPSLANDPQPMYQGSIEAPGQPQTVCDVSQLVLEMKMPSNAKGFSFDFVFGSAEYDEWILKNYNDTFYAILEYSKLNGGSTTNIAFDDNNSEIEVDADFFENAQHLCDETGSGWAPETNEKSGSTGWLRTTWNVEPNDEFKLTFSIHDEGDCIYDSIVFLDNFRFHTEPVEPGTEPVVQ